MSTCGFCKQPSDLLCDGRIYTMPDGTKKRVPMSWSNGKTGTCDAPVCRACAKKVSDIHINARDKNGRRACRWDTIDLCPNCAAVNEQGGAAC